MPHYPEITLLVTHYNRSQSLSRLLSELQKQSISFGEIVVSDDCSRPDQIEQLLLMQKALGFRLLTSSVNKGLGNNINKGQDAVQTPLTLYIQEDFVPENGFAPRLSDAYGFMLQDPTIDFVRFYAYFNYPLLRPFQKGFSKMAFSLNPFKGGYRKFYLYSDHPHLRRSNFLETYGRYREGIKGDATEYQMMMSVLKKKPLALFYEDFQGLLSQANSAAEPSTMTHTRNYYRESQHPVIVLIRHIYRYLKFHFDYLR